MRMVVQIVHINVKNNVKIVKMVYALNVNKDIILTVKY